MLSQSSLNGSKRENQTMEALINVTIDDMSKVNEFILNQLNSHVSLIPEINEHIFSSGGKRLRPMLTIATARAVGYEDDRHIQIAAAIEFMHTATLLHDDVVDESDLRRGSKTARTIWGNKASILIGDFLLGRAFKMVVEVGEIEILDLLSNAASIIAEGEVMQLMASSDLSTNLSQYLQIIESKTAALFAASTVIGSILGKKQEFRDPLYNYGLNLGMAFQVTDDILDYGGRSVELGKNTGDDFREGKITLPVILNYQNCNLEEKKYWDDVIDKDIRTDSDLAIAQELLKKYDSLAAAMQYAENFANKASESLNILPDSIYKDSLYAAVNFCLNRLK